MLFLLKVNLAIAILLIIMFALAMTRAMKIYKRMYPEHKETGKLDMLFYIRGIMMALIPLINIGSLIFMTYMFVIAEDHKYETMLFDRLK